MHIFAQSNRVKIQCPGEVLGMWNPAILEIINAWTNGRQPEGPNYSLAELIGQCIVVAFTAGEESMSNRLERWLRSDSESVDWISSLVHKHWKGFRVRRVRSSFHVIFIIYIYLSVSTFAVK